MLNKVDAFVLVVAEKLVVQKHFALYSKDGNISLHLLCLGIFGGFERDNVSVVEARNEAKGRKATRGTQLANRRRRNLRKIGICTDEQISAALLVQH